MLEQDDVNWEVCQIGLGESVSHVLFVKPVVMGSFKCPGSIVVRWKRAPGQQEEDGGANTTNAASTASETAAQEIRLLPVCTFFFCFDRMSE